MKVVYFSRTEIPSLAANSVQIMKMCNAFAASGHNVKLVNMSSRAPEPRTDCYSFYNVERSFEISQITVLAIENSRFRYLISTIWSAFQLIFKVRKICPDVCYSRDLTACVVAGIFGKSINIFESHYPVFHSRFEAAIFRFALWRKYISRLVLITNALEDTYREFYGEKLPEIVVAPDGADKVSLSDSSTSKLRGRPDTLKVGYVGHLYKGKGIEIITKLATEMPEVDFHIIGGLPEDISYWKNIIDDKNVYFYGFVPQTMLHHYFQALDVCLLPNQKSVRAYGSQENHNDQNIGKFTSPLKLFEYMANRKAIIASDLPVFREVINERVALLVDPEDITGWRRAIEILKNTDQRRKYGTAAFNLFINHYTWQHRVRTVLAGLSEERQ